MVSVQQSCLLNLWWFESGRPVTKIIGFSPTILYFLQYLLLTTQKNDNDWSCGCTEFVYIPLWEKNLKNSKQFAYIGVVCSKSSAMSLTILLKTHWPKYLYSNDKMVGLNIKLVNEIKWLKYFHFLKIRHLLERFKSKLLIFLLINLRKLYFYWTSICTVACPITTVVFNSAWDPFNFDAVPVPDPDPSHENFYKIT